MLHFRIAAAGLGFLILTVASPAYAQLRSTVFISGLTNPLGVVQDPSDPAIQFIVEQGGRIRVVRQGVLLATDFLDLRGIAVPGSERGLLGLAFPANYGSSRRFYVSFTNAAGDSVIARFLRSPGSAVIADPGSRFDFRWPSGNRFIEQPFSNHNGGHIVFGPDGYLYAGFGDGGSSSDPDHRAQDPSTLLGKMLRLDVNVPDSDPNGYRIPPDNPFLDGQPVPALGEIWAFGLRNPWRYSFDDPLMGGTGALVIGDVGQGSWEEIDYEPAGAGGRNYGWRNREGANPHVTSLPPAYLPLVEPIHQYSHDVGRSVTAGFVYRGTALGPAFRGRYFYADFVRGRVWSLGLRINPSTGEAQVVNEVEHTAELGGQDVLGQISSFGIDASGELYLANHRDGSIIGIAAGAAAPPGAPSNLAGSVNGSTVTLTWSAPADIAAPTSYVIEVGSVPGATDLALFQTGNASTRFEAASVPPGTYRVRVRASNANGIGPASNEITIVVGTIPGPCTQPPGPTSELTIAKMGTTVVLNWRAPSGGAPPTSYVIEVGSVSGAADLATLDTGGVATTLTATAPPGTFFVRLRGRNACGLGAPSNEVVVTIP